MALWVILSGVCGLALGAWVGARAGRRRGSRDAAALAQAVSRLLARGGALGFGPAGDAPSSAEGAASAAPGPWARAATGAGLDPLTLEVQRFGQWVEEHWRRSEEERRRLTVVLSGMTEGVLLLDRRGRVLLTNDVAEGLWPSLTLHLRGRHQIELFQDAELDRALARALFQAVPQEVEVARPGATPAAPRRYWRVRIQPLATQAPTDRAWAAGGLEPPVVDGAVMVVEDVTARRDVDRMRRDFVANVSHELQTPLTSIRGYAETLQDEELDSAQRRRFLGRVLEQTERMTALVHDLLSLASLEAPRLMPAEPVDLAELAAELVQDYAAEAERAGIALSLQVADGVRGALVSGRPGELRLAISNLLRNAISYTPAGGSVGVLVGRGGAPVAAGTAPHAVGGRGAPEDVGEGGRDAGREREGDREGWRRPARVGERAWLWVRVTDTGVGIPADAWSRIFERFYRVDAARDRKTGGTGLGLAIVKHAIVGHGGQVDVESTVGRGSCFTVWLPLAAAAREASAGRE